MAVDLEKRKGGGSPRQDADRGVTGLTPTCPVIIARRRSWPRGPRSDRTLPPVCPVVCWMLAIGGDRTRHWCVRWDMKYGDVSIESAGRGAVLGPDAGARQVNVDLTHLVS